MKPMLMTLCTLYAVGFVLVLCLALVDPPPGYSYGERVVFGVIAATFWPVFVWFALTDP